MRGYKRVWITLVGLAILFAAHGVILYYVSSHLAASSAVIAAIIAIVLLKHLGLLGTLYAMLRKARR